MFWKSVYTSLSKKPPRVSERVVFADFDQTGPVFLNIKTEEDLKFLLLNY